MNSTFYDERWALAGLVLLALAFYVAVCRQALQAFSRRLFLDSLGEEERAEMEAVLEHEDDYAASLRSADLLLRLTLGLSLAFGRLTVSPERWRTLGFGAAATEFVLLGAAIGGIFLLFLEILPGVIARVRPEERLKNNIKMIILIHKILIPLRSIPAAVVRWGVEVFGGSMGRASVDILEEDILNAAEEGEREGLLKSRDIDMIESIITFGHVEVAQVMTPRTEMVCLDLEEPLDVNIKKAIHCGHSRIPLYKESKDNIVGLLYVKDLLKYWNKKESVALRDLMRKPHFVPVTKKIGELFQEFKTQRFHIAIILDEFGGTSGLITIEDIIEEIVGEITDEFEKTDRALLKHVSPGVVEVDGSLKIGDLNDQLKIDVPEDQNYDTIGGFIASHVGKIPIVGETFQFDTLNFEVTSSDARRIRKLRIHLPLKEAGSPGDGLELSVVERKHQP